jgi:hypothetical protein
MLPNVFGNIGGAEKIGWSTHYHITYFPFLIYAASKGYIKIWLKCKSLLYRIILYLFIVIIIFLYTGLYLYSLDNLKISYAQILDNAWVKTVRTISDYFDEKGSYAYIYKRTKRIRDVIPENTIISVPEFLMVSLYKNRNICYYPMGLDDADYIIVTIVNINSKPPIYSGAVTYLGEENRKKLDEYLVKCMDKNGYDIYNPVVIDNIAIIKRKKFK